MRTFAIHPPGPAAAPRDIRTLALADLAQAAGAAAVDRFLRLDGIKGESDDDRHSSSADTGTRTASSLQRSLPG